jgi:hypothetical protein
MIFDDLNAADLYDRVYFWAELRRLWASFTRQRSFLLDLAEVTAACTVRERRSLGLRVVPVEQIRGSEGRARDFDAAFRPLHTHTAARWLAIIRMIEHGADLPPVELIQVGDVYFVRDGHHRVSVARARRHRELDAVVTLWEVEGALPWERAANARRGARILRRIVANEAG